jgi:deoxyribonuclease V
MRIRNIHSWDVNVQQALEIQRNLASEVFKEGNIRELHLVAGLDVSVNLKNEATAAAVVLNYPELTIMETVRVQGKVEFPYVPGLLSFREVPLTLKACEQLRLTPDLFLVDGQGIAHPRRIGLASHLGLFLETPTIGCAKSLLTGKFEQPPDTFGSYSDIQDKGETIGVALRTKVGVKPVFVSIGHKIELSTGYIGCYNVVRVTVCLNLPD